ncbi:MAG: aminotransferase class V-fold PLP-dependent enzyme [Gemmataceae bacterium]|nr:aminotransferase class V-fold PLP-dependent enzyme [Gemmataceae bacterium]
MTNDEAPSDRVGCVKRTRADAPECRRVGVWFGRYIAAEKRVRNNRLQMEFGPFLTRGCSKCEFWCVRASTLDAPYYKLLGLENISHYERELLVYATEAMSRVPGLRLIGTATGKASVLSFVMDDYRNEDIGCYLDHKGIAVRAGHHCAQPTMRRFGVESTVRPSLAFYNTHAEIDTLVTALRRARTVLGRWRGSE